MGGMKQGLPAHAWPVGDAAENRSEAAALRVAVVTETYPPEVNGVALTLARMVQGLAERGHRVTVVRPRQIDESWSTSAAASDVATMLVRGLPIPSYPHLRMGLPAGRDLLHEWQRRRPDLVHVATEGPLGHSAVRAARRLGITVTSDFRTNFHAYTQHYGIGWLRRPILAYLRSFHNRTALTMVPTEALRMQLEALGFHDLAVVARGVDVGRFDPARRSTELRRSWGAADADAVVLHVGRLAAEKNLGLLARAFESIQRLHPTARLLLVGDGPQRAALQAQIPGAIFAGQRHGTDLATHYASADLFLFPSLTETFGNVTAEAMASGLPVVAFDYAAAAQLIRPGRSGMLVARCNEAQFEQVAVALAGSRAMRAALGEQARRDAGEHDWGPVLGRFERLLLQALGTRPVAPAHTMSGVNAACSTTWI